MSACPTCAVLRTLGVRRNANKQSPHLQRQQLFRTSLKAYTNTSAAVSASQQDQDGCSLALDQSISLTPQFELTRRNIIALSVLVLQIHGLTNSPPATALGCVLLG